MTKNRDDSDPLNLSPVPEKQKMVAVALGGGKSEKAPPEILAAGRGDLAEQILAIAFEKGIKVREDAPLAEMLAQLELDTPIPSEAIVVVAEILGKVYEYNAQALHEPS